MRETQSAPGSLELVRCFVNTRDIEDGTDELEDVGSAHGWLAGQGLIDSGTRLSDSDRRQLIAVRELLREMMLANNAGQEPADTVLEEFNAAVADTALQVRFAGASTELVARGTGVAAAIGELLAIVHAAHVEGSWGRLKVCPASDCQWAFYDRSRNRSATWCQMGACGNRSKARAFRARRRPRGNGGG